MNKKNKCRFCNNLEKLNKEENYYFKCQLIAFEQSDKGEYTGHKRYGLYGLNYCPMCGKKVKDNFLTEIKSILSIKRPSKAMAELCKNLKEDLEKESEYKRFIKDGIEIKTITLNEGDENYSKVKAFAEYINNIKDESD